MLQHFAGRTPGSFIEDKEFSLVWHYRLSESRFSDWLGQELVAMLDDMLAETELRAIRGRKSSKFVPDGFIKASPRRFVTLAGPAEFQLAAGDDRADEDMFEALDAPAWTVHVGAGRSRARWTPSGAHRMSS